MTYEETISYLFEQLPMFQRTGPVAFKKDLGNIIKLSEAIGNPHEQLKCIHIAGTNGKGSVTHILGSIFQAKGLQVGLYTSPHYKDYRERIKINGEYIDKDSVSQFVREYKSIIETIEPSFFEITVAMAFWYFAKQKIDFAVIETGLGGRLDSTNIINPLLSVITNISLDHTNFLGDTIPLIAAEKAGIMEEGKAVVIGLKQEESTAVFSEIAKSRNAPLYFAEDIINLDYDGNDEGKDVYTACSNKNEVCYFFDTDITGPFQKENITTALAAIEIYNEQYNNEISIDNIVDGLQQVKQSTNYIGRWTILQNKPKVILDSAHNETGIKTIFKHIKTLKYKKLHIVYGAVKDKSIDTIVKLIPTNAIYYLCQPGIPRGLAVEALAELFVEQGLEGLTFDSVELAKAAAVDAANEDDLVLVTGSCFVVAEVV